MNELAMLGLPPATTSDPVRAAAIAAEVTQSPAIFSHAGEPSNADKMAHVRSQFECETCDLHSVFPYAQTLVTGHPGQKQAASFLSDLRCQYIKRLLAEKLVPPLIGNLMYVRNRVWYVRYREQLGLHLEAMSLKDRNKTI